MLTVKKIVEEKELKGNNVFFFLGDILSNMKSRHRIFEEHSTKNPVLWTFCVECFKWILEDIG